ncbi:type VI secretion system tip protein TssI/VgrG, partial [Pasteurellaceae bacterium LIM206]|nr:type VI secretion system tip protein TssI/VgrG [Pasteurellaceae bacterium LIM206]
MATKTLTDRATSIKPSDGYQTLSGVNDLTDSIGTAAELTGNEKLAGRANTVKGVVSQAKHGASVMNDVIHRVQRISGGGTSQSQSLSKVKDETNPLDYLTALFNRTPSGLQFTLETSGKVVFSVTGFNFRAGYNELYRLEIEASSPDSAVEAMTVLDNAAVLSIWQDGEVQQTISGMVTEFEQGDSGFRRTYYRLTIQPDLWRASLRHNSRIFQQKDIQSILSVLLSENHVTDYGFTLRQPHPVREFCVQYQETDYAFLQRLCAEEGIFYYFEQDEGRHRLVLTDDAVTLNDGVRLSYNPNKGAQLQEKVITKFSYSERVRPSHTVLKDYTFKKPDWQATYNEQAKDAENQRTGYEHYDYPGRFKDGRGQQYTRYRLESLRRDAHLGKGESNSGQLQVGKRFVLSQHPNGRFNTTWQVVSLEMEGRQPQAVEQESGEKGTTLVSRFEFLPRQQNWRAEQRTKPRVDGPQIALVTGPKEEEIYTDNFGRVKLQFLWDRYTQNDDHSSCWIR